MNEKLQKTALTFSHSITSYLRRASKPDFKALCVVHDLSERKRHTFSSLVDFYIVFRRLSVHVLRHTLLL